MANFDITSPFHVGHIVEDVEAAMAQISQATGVTWHPPQDFALDIDMGGERVQIDVNFTYSKEGPVQIEVAQGPAGTLWDPSIHGPSLHNGYWTSDLAGQIDELTAGGFELLYNGVGDDPGPQGYAMLLTPSGLRVELVDEAMLPLFEHWYATGSFT